MSGVKFDILHGRLAQLNIIFDQVIIFFNTHKYNIAIGYLAEI